MHHGCPPGQVLASTDEGGRELQRGQDLLTLLLGRGHTQEGHYARHFFDKKGKLRHTGPQGKELLVTELVGVLQW